MYLIYVPPYLLARWTSLPFTRARSSSQNPPPSTQKWCVPMEIGNRGREGERDRERAGGKKRGYLLCLTFFCLGGTVSPLSDMTSFVLR